MSNQTMSYPTKLIKYLEALPEDQRQARETLYAYALKQAETHKFQSPRFWAMRQVISGISMAQVEEKIKRRVVSSH
ncbi:MAG: hypothetical protein K9N55_19940 [Phycisphaerae bacterium]|nr:hypothetical protein [Phycisphaerae bacterium]